MKKKYVIIGLTGLLFIISGICYSCAYHDNTPTVLIAGQSTDAGSSTDAQSGMDTQNVANTQNKADTGEAASQNGADEGIVVTASKTQTSNMDNPGINQTDTQMQPTQVSGIYVHLCGAVMQPGVYQVEDGSRLVDLIRLSGGLTADAAGDYINQAVQVSDGQRIYIPTVKEVKDLTADEYIQGDQSNTKSGSGPEAAAPSKVNINIADTEMLMELPGIGEAKANSIINYRNKYGRFKTIEELMNIPGIKEGLFGQISSLIVTE